MPNEVFMDEQLEQTEYRTGDTHLPEKQTGPIAALFICVIFLVGLVSALGLLKDYFTADAPPIAFGPGEVTEEITQDTCLTHRAPLGFSCQSMAMTYRYVHNLPAGLFINFVEPESQAASLGIQPGDVLVSIDGNPVTTPELLHEILNNYADGDQAVLGLYHENGEISVTLIMDYDQE